MPIEIKELKIKAVVAPQEKVLSNTQAGITPDQLERMKEEIIKECMSKVKAYLKEQNER